MDIPDADNNEFRHWVDVITYGVGSLTVDDHELSSASQGVGAFFDDIIEVRRRHPGDDIISLLVGGGDALERPLTSEEMTAFAMFLFIAGTDTTTGLLANWLGMAVGERPDIFQAVRRRRSDITPSIEEMLRYQNSNQAVARCVVRDTQLAGVKLPRVRPSSSSWVRGTATSATSAQTQTSTDSIATRPMRSGSDPGSTCASAPRSRASNAVSPSKPCASGPQPSSWSVRSSTTAASSSVPARRSPLV